MQEPKMVKGMLGWAAIGAGHMVYAKSRSEALRRWKAAVAAQQSINPGTSEIVAQVEEVSEDVVTPDDARRD
jgi:hypothetical protein